MLRNAITIIVTYLLCFLSGVFWGYLVWLPYAVPLTIVTCLALSYISMVVIVSGVRQVVVETIFGLRPVMPSFIIEWAFWNDKDIRELTKKQ